jgi:release factor glutamine methyltransferase
MKAGDVHRGRGPWPKSNDAVAVRQWLTDRIAVFESRERQAIIRQLLDDVSGVSRADRLIGNWVASESQLERLALACDRLNHGEPLQYILGTAHFMGLDVCVNKSVLIPRPETEELVHRMLQYISSSKSQKRKVVDIGAGSGAISLAWKAKRPMDEVYGLDVSPEALHTARY